MFDSLSDKLQDVFDGLRGKGRLSEEDIDLGIREIRIALLEADVNFKVVKGFCRNVKEQCMSAQVMESLTPGQNIVKIVLDELTSLLGEKAEEIHFSERIPNVIMLVGLQGSGKTTSAAKLAYRLKKSGHQPLLVACDVYRPAAQDQLEALAKEQDVRIYRDDSKDPVAIAQAGVQDAIDNLRDVVIIDTAGRLHVDQDMMDEAVAIRDAVNPDEILMVVDAMTGQDVVNVVSSFAEQVDFDGVIMSKMDGDARGGGALSIREVTGKPIKFISAGEKPDSLEVFHPDRMAKRILGMGDVVSVIERAIEVQDQEIEEEQAERLAKAQFGFDDFLQIIGQTRKMGGLGKLVSALPGGSKALAGGQVDEGELDRTEAIINSMTLEERKKPSLLNGSRRARIAAGSGTSVQQVNQLVKRFNDTRKMVKKMMAQFNQMGMGKKNKKGKRKKIKIPGMGGIDLSRFMDDLDDLDLPQGFSK